jgi:peptide/nickel transport system permease protein
MGRFLLQRLPALLPVLLLVLVIVFALARLIPGDPAVTLLGPGATSQQIEAPWAARWRRAAPSCSRCSPST